MCSKAAIFRACEVFNKFNFFQGTNRDRGTDQWRYSPIPEIIRWIGTSFRRNDFWERLDKGFLWLVDGCLGYHRPIITKLKVLLLVFWVECLFLLLQLHITDEKKKDKHTALITGIKRKLTTLLKVLQPARLDRRSTRGKEKLGRVVMLLSHGDLRICPVFSSR